MDLKYRIIAEGDDSTCRICRGFDGKEFFMVECKEGVNAPPFHPNCRCTYEIFEAGGGGYGGSGGRETEGAGSAKGLIGKDFEDYLTKEIGGKGSFSKGGRDFDGGVGNRWWEAKSGDYWTNRVNNPTAINKFKSDMGQRLQIAQENGATYELFSNAPIPQVFKDYLIKKGIPFTEILN